MALAAEVVVLKSASRRKEASTPTRAVIRPTSVPLKPATTTEMKTIPPPTGSRGWSSESAQ